MSAQTKSTRLFVLFIAMLAAAACASCDILRSRPFCVISWTPGEGRFGSDDDLTASVTFSEEPDRVSAENAFSMTENGAAIAGSFSWDGVTLRFDPCMTLRDAADFRVSVGAGARNPRGVSLEDILEGRFSTRLEDGRPSIVSTEPERGGILEGILGSVSLVFSEPVDAASYRECLSLTPAITGVWRLGDDGATATFSPLEPWVWAAEYRLTVSGDLSDSCGNRMGESVSLRFTVGDDAIQPSVIGAQALDKSGALVSSLLPDDPSDGFVTENAEWEADWRFRVSFSENVSMRSLEGCVESEGGPSVTLESLDDMADSAVFRLDERPAWGKRFAIRIRAGMEDANGNPSESDTVFRFLADGPHSAPPRFMGIRMPLAPGETNPEDRDLAVFALDEPYSTLALSGGTGSYPLGVATNTSLELYIEVAPGACLDPASIMESFTVSGSNGAIDVSLNRVTIAGFEYATPHAPWAACSVARIDGTLTNRVNSGIVTFALAAGFRDSSWNATCTAQSLPLLK